MRERLDRAAEGGREGCVRLWGSGCGRGAEDESAGEESSGVSGSEVRFR